MTIGAELRRWRKDAEFTLSEIAEEVGLSIVHISQIERGTKNAPAPDVLFKWLRFLGKEDHFERVLVESGRTRKSLKISLTGKSNQVVDMAGSLARKVESDDIDDVTAKKIFEILKRSRKRK